MGRLQKTGAGRFLPEATSEFGAATDTSIKMVRLLVGVFTSLRFSV
jgi:hypothetical protein